MKHLLLFLSLALAAFAADPVVIIIPQSPPKDNNSAIITRTPDGKTFTTTRWGNGTITRSQDGKSYTTTPWGNGTITRTPDGKFYTTRSTAPAKPSPPPRGPHASAPEN